MTPEEHAQRDETQHMVRERVAYHEAKAREEEEARRPGRSSRLTLAGSDRWARIGASV